MTYERDEVWGTPDRRTLARTRPDTPSASRREEPSTRRLDAGFDPTRPPMDGDTAHAFGPEATERAQMMAYERTRLIQQESPFVREEVVEHRVHDYRLYIGLWLVAALSMVSAFLTYSLWHAGIAAVAVTFALYCSPGRSRYEE